MVNEINRGVWVYDIETFGNFFSCIFLNIDTKERQDFIVCEWQDDLGDFMHFVSNKNIMKGMVGLLRLTLNQSNCWNTLKTK